MIRSLDLSLEYSLLHCLADFLILPVFTEHEKELRSYLQAQPKKNGSVRLEVLELQERH